MKDTYNTIAFSSEETLFKEKNSKFFGYAFPIESEDEVKPITDRLRKQHPNACHYCYAYQLGADSITYRANDDGEPSNTAGMPIYGQIQSFGEKVLKMFLDIIVTTLKILKKAGLNLFTLMISRES